MRGECLPGSWTILFVRAMVEHPAGYKAPPRPRKLAAGVVVAFDEIQLSRHPGSIGFGAAVPRPARLHAYASPIPFLESAQGLLPAWAGSPLAGRVSHPLDGKQSFMKASPPPIPFDQQSLVALNFLSAACRIPSEICPLPAAAAGPVPPGCRPRRRAGGAAGGAAPK